MRAAGRPVVTQRYGRGNRGAPGTPLAACLVQLRLRTGLTQKEFAAQIGTSQAQVSAYELGGREPSLTVLKRYATVSGISVSEVLDGVL